MSQDLPSSKPASGLAKFMDRRGFLRSSAVAGGSLYLATAKGAVAQGEAAGRTVKCALVGCGAQGDRLRVAASKIPSGIQWVAVCDIWNTTARGGPPHGLRKQAPGQRPGR